MHKHKHTCAVVCLSHIHTLKSDNFMSNCFPGDMKQHLSKRKHGSSSGCEAGEAGGEYCDWGVRAEQAKIGRRVDLQLPDVQLVLLPCVRTTLLPHPTQCRMFKITVCVCGQLNLPDGTAFCNIQIVFNIICLFVK